MKKLVFSLAIIFGLSFCSTRVFAQNVQQYEYGTLQVVGEKYYFFNPDGTVEVNPYPKPPAELRTFKLDFTTTFAYNAAINAKAKEGWEVVNSDAAPSIYIILRRSIKK